MKVMNIVTKNDKITNLKVVFAPLYTQGNPYQTLLIKHLTSLGVQIDMNSCDTFSLLSTIEERKANILHIHWLDSFFLRVSFLKSLFNLMIFLLQLIFLRLLNVKIIWTVHNLKNHRNQHLILDKIASIFVSRIAHGLIVHSESARNETVKAFRLHKKNNIFIVPHGNYIDVYENKISQLEARKQLNIPSSNLVLLFFGSIHPYKGISQLIEAFKQLNHDDICLLIAGKPCSELMATQLNKEVKDHKNIIFIPGFVSEEQIQLYMNACDVVALPYQEFLTSGAVILAMSFGKACIAPDKGYIGEVLSKQGGFLYDPENEDGLLEVLNSLIHKRTVISNMGKHNYQLATQWNWNYVAKLTLKVYEYYLKN
ncbi:group 1 glycosyl transferase [Calothrix brevissima NIES-22]|nr:group 1 glycosyl transferase [Calothrix brevissima NIES-22]